MAGISPNIFKEYDIRGRYPSEIDKNAAYRIGRAFVLSQKAKKIVVGRDFRWESGQAAEEFVRGVLDQGGNVYDLAVNSTPAMFFAVGVRGFDGGAAVTASHNPDGYTGFKLCGSNGILIGAKSGLNQIAALADKLKPRSGRPGKIIKMEIFADYFRFVNSLVDLSDIRGFKLVLDASSGSGAQLADYIFVRSAAKIIKMNFRSGDRYPDHGLNPMLAANQKLARHEVKRNQADLGIIWDGDGDRCIFIDEQGRFVEPYYINCLIAKIILARYRRARIAIDARLPVGLSQVISQAGGRPVICRSGYANIVQLMQRKRILFGCENSGHYFFNFLLSDNNKKNFIFGDAIIPVLLILQYLGSNNLTLSKAVGDFKKTFIISGEINFPIKDFQQLEKSLIRKYRQYRQERLDGLSVYADKWFFNVRPSHTEPLARLNIEAVSRPVLRGLKKDLIKFIH